MNKVTFVFPAAAVAFLLLVFFEYILVKWKKTDSPVERHISKRKRLVLPPEEHVWQRADTVCMLAVTAVYAVVAFLGLGNTYGVQSWCKFENQGAYALIELSEPAEIGAVRYFPELHTGNYYLQASLDGETYTDVCTLPQEYADVLKWKDAELPEASFGPVKYIRLIADNPLWLGELALYDADGRLLAAGRDLIYPAEIAALFDEQDLIPERYDYMNSSYFDEIYHARTALEHIENVYPYEITHPPLGKLILGLGIRLFGMTPFGWRFSGTLIGVLMLPALYYFLKKMFGGTLVPCCCTAVFAFDFMHYVQTRIATIDSYSVFFTILMYLFFWLYLNADRTRRKSWLPKLALSGVCFGLGAASKWTCIYAGAGLAVLWLIDRILRGAAQIREGNQRACLREAGENILWCLLFFVLVPGLVYYVSYWPYGAARGLDANGLGMLFSRDYLHIVLDNQKYMFNYHSGVTSTHPYSSVWWQWILDIRPILYYLQYPSEGMHVSFAAFVSPLLCWGGLLAMLCTGYQAVRRRDRDALFILIGYLAVLLPWVFVSRIVFEYHYFPATVFLTLALGHVFRTLEKRGGQAGRQMVCAFTTLSLVLFAVFYPALRGLPVSKFYGDSFLGWLPTWPL